MVLNCSGNANRPELSHTVPNRTLPCSGKASLVFVATLSAHRDPVDQVSIGANRLVVAFLKGAVRLKLPVWAVCSQWDLQMVLDRLCLAPYEPVEQADIRSLSMKTACLLAITSVRRVCELHALSVSSQYCHLSS